jgi:hypothetical protein
MRVSVVIRNILFRFTLVVYIWYTPYRMVSCVSRSLLDFECWLRR